MPNILKRPMFRKGGSTSEGTGITTGLVNRKQYKDGPSKEEILKTYVEDLKQQNRPTQRQRIGDFITAFGATGASDRPLTFGQAISMGAAGGQKLFEKRKDRAASYNAALDSQLLKLFANDQEKMNSFKVTLRAKAENAVATGKFKTVAEAEKALFNEVYNDVIKRPRADATPAAIIRGIAQSLVSGKKADPIDANAMAKTIYKKDIGEIKIDINGYIEKDADSGDTPVMILGDGAIAKINKKYDPTYKNEAGISADFKNGFNYLHPNGSIYKYETGGTFRRVYP